MLIRCAEAGIRPGQTVSTLFSRVLGPPDPDRPLPRRRASPPRALELKALTLRFPPHLLLFHASSKAWRAMRNLRGPGAEPA